MDNVAFSSDQRVFVLKRPAVSKCVSPSRDAEQVFSGRLSLHVTDNDPGQDPCASRKMGLNFSRKSEKRREK